MKNLIRAACCITAVLVLSACGAKDIQPITSLTDTAIGNMQVTEVNVKWSDEYLARIEDEKDILKEKEEKLANATSKTSIQKAKKNVSRQQNKLEELEKELVDVPTEVKAGIEAALSGRPAGDLAVLLNVVVNSFSLTNGASVILVGGSDSMSAIVNIIDAKSQEKIGEYFITDHDSNAAGGLLGLMVRGGDPRGDMVKQFSEKVAETLYGKES